MTVTTSLALVLGSGLLAAALPAQAPFAVAPDTCTPPNTPKARDTYYGNDRPVDPRVPTAFRISNGGAGLSGLVGHIADAFIASELQSNTSLAPFKVCPAVAVFN